MPQLRPSRISGVDTLLLAAVLALTGIGLLAIFSASHVSYGMGKVVRQGIWVLLGLAGAWGLSRLDYRPWARYWRLLLLLSSLALAATLIIAHPVNGARSWIDLGAFRLQPSEFAKIAVIVALAGVLSRFGDKLLLPRYLGRTLLYIAAPIALILAQPAFGTAMVLCGIWLTMALVAGARWWHLSLICLSAVLLFVLACCLPLFHGKTLLRDYQKRRLDFLHADPAGAGYHQRQARIAIGTGEFWGRGYLHGTQAVRGFLPEQDTDFIFAVIGEEFGFLGCVLVVGLYLCVFYRLLQLIEEAETPFGRYIVAGITAMLVIHMVENIAMCLSLAPVTGIPLPFISYGGSNILTNLLAIGIALSISRHRERRRNWVVQDELVRSI